MCISICVQGLNKIPKWSDQNFSLVIFLSLFLILGLISLPGCSDKSVHFFIVKLLSWPARVAASF